MRQTLDVADGVETVFHHDTDKIHIEHRQDCEAIVEDNKARQSMPQKGFFRKVASIPNVVLYQWLVEDGIMPHDYMRMNHHEKMAWYRKRLNSHEYKFLRAVESYV